MIFFYADFFQNYFLLEKIFWNATRVSNSLDPDQDRVGPDLGPNRLQRFTAGDTIGQGVKALKWI